MPLNKPMKTELRPSQIQRINRLKMARYQKQKSETKTEAIIFLLFILWIAVCVAVSVVNRKQQSGELITSLASLDSQRPSITIYGGE